MEYMNHIIHQTQNFVYYNLVGAVLLTSVLISLEYVTDSDNFVKNMERKCNTVKYWAADKTVSLYSIYKDFFPDVEELEKEINEMSYNNNGDLCESNSPNLLKSYRLVKIDESDYFIDINNEKNEPNKFILKVEIRFNNQVIDITKELTKFCVVGAIFDKYFIKAFMKHIFNKDVETYTLFGMTTSCEMLDITDEKTLCVESGKIDIINLYEKNVEEDFVPVVEEPVEPDVEEDVKPAVEEPIEPAVEEPVEPAVEEPVEPAVEEDVEPAVEEPVEPAVEEPVEPAVEEPVEPAVEEDVEPVVEEDVEPVVEEDVEIKQPDDVLLVNNEVEFEEINSTLNDVIYDTIDNESKQMFNDKTNENNKNTKHNRKNRRKNKNKLK